MYIFYLILLLVPMLALKRRDNGDTDILDSPSTTSIKGVVCFYVMFHNLGLDLEGNSYFKELLCEHTGGIGVGLFFFLSAFGIIRSYQKNGNKYLPRLIFVHIPKLYIIAVFINCLTYFTFLRGAFEGVDLWMRILNLDLLNNFNRINRHGWYIATIIALYLLFALVYFICSKLKSEKRFIIAGVSLAAIVVLVKLISRIADEGGMYTREMPAFALGCLYATFYREVNALAKKFFTPLLCVSIAAFILGFFIWEPLATYAAVAIIITVSQKYIYKSPITHFFGKLAIGIYLYLHFSSIVMQPFISNEYLWVLTNAGFIIELAAITYAAEYALTYLFKKAGSSLKTASLKK